MMDVLKNGKIMTDYELPNISVDVVPVFADPDTNRLKVFVGRRIFEPFLGYFALPGVLLSPHERIDEAAMRALEQKTGIPGTAITGLYDLGTFDNPDRDPRGATVSIARLAVVDPKFIPTDDNTISVDVTEVINDIFTLPFDHSTIVKAAVTTFTEKFLTSKKFTFDVLGAEFATKTIRGVMQQVSALDVSSDHVVYDPSNLTRQLKATGWVTPVGDTSSYATSNTVDTVGTLRGRPSRTWTWN